jgi:hypothetical protein
VGKWNEAITPMWIKAKERRRRKIFLLKNV